ncbi:MAG: EpsG family protein, partial [Bacteroidales bacterium]|nr:EpsG family protein [Bacteroidales bacterium]
MLFYFGWHYNARFTNAVGSHTAKEFFLSWEIIASIVLFTLITGLRYHTGWDHECYIRDYVQYQTHGTIYRPDFEPGFRLIETIFAKLGCHYSVFFGFLGFVNVFFLYLGLRKQRETLPWMGICMMMGMFYIHLMNSIRQGVVECVFVAMLLLIENRKYLWYFAISLALVTIHKVALLLIPLFFVANFSLKIKWKWALLSGYVVCFVLGQFPELFSWTINANSKILDLLGYSKYVELFNHNANYAFHRSPIGFMTISIMLVHLALIFYYPKMKEFFKGNRFFSMTYRLSYFYICFFVLALNTAKYFKRPSELTLPFFVIAVAFLMVYLLKKKAYLPLAILLLLNVSITVSTHIKCYLHTSDYLSTYLYHFLP